MDSASPKIEIDNGIASFPGAGIGSFWSAALLVLMISLALCLPVGVLSEARAENLVSSLAISAFWLAVMSPIFYFMHRGVAKSTIKFDLVRRMMCIDMVSITFVASSLQFPLEDIADAELLVTPQASLDGPPLPRAVLRLKSGNWIAMTNSYSQSLFPSFNAQKVREAGALVEAVQGLLRSARASGGAVPSTV